MPTPPLKHLNRESLPLFRERFTSIAADARPQFGTLSPAAMFAHLRVFLEISLGERTDDKDISTIITRSPLFFFLVMDIMPWPKGKIKAPDELTPPPSGDVETERQAMLDAMERFVAALESDPNKKATSPLAGPRPR
ncbi:MAG: hypothetical protein JJU11_12660, partial [Candidatus Sumerlaeia bacterium]|nr:hypothetical protein [Candidatus Sumerlaeia bacterium]